MTEEEIPDYNIFMMCNKLNNNALSKLNIEFYFRNCQPNELETWKAFPFDSEIFTNEYNKFMNQFIEETYKNDLDTFFKNTFFVCNKNNKPVATCTHWKAYKKFNAIHWLKTHKSYEGKGIGRALLTKIMENFEEKDYPIFLHTQPSSFRAIKLYSDFGFKLLQNDKIGTRQNELSKSLPILNKFMLKKDFDELKIIETPENFIKLLENEITIQF